MQKMYGSAILLPLLLSGCGGGSDANSQSEPAPTAEVPMSQPLNTQYYGVWGIEGLAYAMISESSVTTTVFDVDRGCYESDHFIVTASDTDSLTTSDVRTGETSTTSFSLNGSQLVLQEGGGTLELSNTNFFNPTPGCDSRDSIDNIEVAIELSYLPPYVTINRDAQDSGRIEYDYQINFDLNENDVLDAGDASIKIRHFKSDRDYPANHQLTLSELNAQVWIYVPRQQSDGVASTSVKTNTVQLTQQGSTLTFDIDPSMHAFMSNVSQDTPVQIQTSVSYPEPETTVIEDWLDGPWNWSSERHSDSLPDAGFTQADMHANMVIDDAESDQTEGESMWVDIKSVSFSFN